MTTYYVADSDGSDSYDGLADTFVSGTNGPWKTINFSLTSSAASAGDTIEVRTGDYREKVDPTKDGTTDNYITVKNYTGESPKITGVSSPGSQSAGFVLDLNGREWLWFEGMQIYRDHGQSASFSNISIELVNESNDIYFKNVTQVSTLSTRNTLRSAGKLETGVSLTNVQMIQFDNFNSQYMSRFGMVVSDTATSTAEKIRWFNGTKIENMWQDAVHVSDIGASARELRLFFDECEIGGSYMSDSIQVNQYQHRGPVNARGMVFRKCHLWGTTGENAIDLKGGGYATVEYCVIRAHPDDSGGPDDGLDRFPEPGAIKRGSGDTSKFVIIRSNILYNNHGGVDSRDGGYKMYNNNFLFNNKDYSGDDSTYDPTNKPGYPSTSLTGVSSEKVSCKNNIFAYANHAEVWMNDNDYADIDYNIYHAESGKGPFCSVFRGSNDFDQYDLSSDFSGWKTALQGMGNVTGEDANSSVTNPLFQDVPVNPTATPDNYIFLLQSGSPAINAATHLTQANGAGSSSTSLTVDDASYFHDGYGMPSAWVTGDEIIVGTNSAVGITDVNYSTNVITLDAAITWSDNDNVWLADSAGTKILLDIGAYDWFSKQIQPPPENDPYMPGLSFLWGVS